MYYLHTETLTQYTIDELRVRHPNASLPVNADCAVLGYERLTATPYPAYDRFTEDVRPATPVKIRGEWRQQWEVYPLPAEDVAALATSARIQRRQGAKQKRAEKVDAITVTTKAGHTFDGDETSQNRMARAIIALSTGLAPSVTWVLADNSVIAATAAELTEALALAGQAQAAVWVIQGENA